MPYDLMLLATDAARGSSISDKSWSIGRRGWILRKPRRTDRRGNGCVAPPPAPHRPGGIVTPVRPDRACYDVRLKLPSNPLVSIVIPTAGKIAEIGGRRIDLLFNCLDKLAANTSYKNIEIIVVHNGDLGAARLEDLAKRGVKTRTYRGDVNVARKLNIGAAEGQGDYLLLLNDDIEPIAPDWIERMLEHFREIARRSRRRQASLP